MAVRLPGGEAAGSSTLFDYGPDYNSRNSHRTRNSKGAPFFFGAIGRNGAIYGAISAKRR
jgi:hypothetical protein